MTLSNLQRRMIGGVSLLPLALSWTALASAQTGKGGATEEIIVTAQKREERIQDVPMAISAFSEAAITRMNMTRPQDLVQHITNATATDNGGQPRINIRGVTLNEFSGGNENPIGYYVDEVYQGTLSGSIGDTFDIQRVEVLKGPQGTLFGRNTTGGLVHWITQRPTDAFQGYASAQYGSFDQVILEGAAGGRVVDGFRIRIAGKFNRDDGWQRNTFNGARFAKKNNISGRINADWDIAPGVEGEFNVHGSRIRGQADAISLRGLLDPTTFAPCPADDVLAGRCVSLLGQKSNFLNPRKVESERDKLRLNVDAYGGYARFKADLGGDVQLISITAYEYVKRLYEQDSDASAAPVTVNLDIITGGAVPLRLPNFYNRQGGKTNQFSQEVRLTGTLSSVEWMLGAFYYKDDRDHLFMDIPGYRAVFGSGVGLDDAANVDTRSWAVFGRVRVPLGEKVNMSVSGRYTDEHRDLLLADNFENPSFLDREKLDASVLTYRADVYYSPRDNLLFYASTAKGFKGGSFKTVFAGPGEGVGSRPEILYSYEAGMKSDLVPGRLRLNLSGFYYDYHDLQGLGAFTRNGVPGYILTNVGDAKIYGGEADSSFTLVDGLNGTLGLGYLHTRISSDNLQFDGKEQSAAPHYTVNASLRYAPDWNLLGGQMNVEVSGNYRSRQYLDIENTPTMVQRAYTLVDGSIGWQSDVSGMAVDLFVTNAFDKVYAVGGFTVADFGLNSMFMGQPRRIGARISYKW